MILESRPYQLEIIDKLREALRTNNRALLSSATGSGKSFIFSHITKSALNRNFSIWVIVPLKVLISQTSDHFRKWDIPHALIAQGHQESRAFNVHIVSKQTIERRWHKIKNWPDLIMIDEAHINYDFQLELIERMPETTKLIGLTATPEREDGRGLSTPYQVWVKGPEPRELVEKGYLCKVRYFSPPLEGIEELHRKGIDVDADELEALFKNRAIYGKVIDQWAEYSKGKPTLAYCRNIKAAEEWAHRFREAGFPFENIDGTMKNSKRKAIIEALTEGKISGITSVNLIAYGFDCPLVESILKLRPTESKALDSQMNGRGLRNYEKWLIDGKIVINPVIKPPGSELLYKKECVIIHDFVHNLRKHGHPLTDYEWNFYGKEKRKKIKDESADKLKLCPICWEYECNCQNKKRVMPDRNIIEINGRLVEHDAPIALKDRPYEERKEYHDKIIAAKNAYLELEKTGKINLAPIKELCEIAESLGRSVMWVYYELNKLEKLVNIPLLKAIEEIKGYKKGWSFFKIKELRSKIENGTNGK
jgi:superfamily II DNA or RNA helicase